MHLILQNFRNKWQNPGRVTVSYFRKHVLLIQHAENVECEKTNKNKTGNSSMCVMQTTTMRDAHYKVKLKRGNKAQKNAATRTHNQSIHWILCDLPYLQSNVLLPLRGIGGHFYEVSKNGKNQRMKRGSITQIVKTKVKRVQWNICWPFNLQPQPLTLIFVKPIFRFFGVFTTMSLLFLFFLYQINMLCQ